MSTWIKMRTDLRDDPRIIQTADILGMDELTVLGAYYCLWVMGDVHTTNGHLSGISPARLDKRIGLAGFAAAAEKVGWLSVDSDGFVSIPRFADHNGESAKKRAVDAARKAHSRGFGRGGREVDSSRTKSGQLSELEQEHRAEQEEEKINANASAPNGELSAASGMPAHALPESDTTRKQKLRDILKRAKISGRNFDLLAESKLTAADVERHWKRVSTDPSARKPLSVLVSALKEAAGLNGEPAVPVDPETRKAQVAAGVKRWNAAQNGAAP